MNEHTPEPSGLTLMTGVLPVERALIDAQNPGENLIGLDVEGYAVVMDSEVHRRIVACVNACRGIETEQIEEMIAQNLDFAHMLARARKYQEFVLKYNGDAVQAVSELREALRERDEARAMVKRLADALRNLDDCDDYEELISEADPQDIPESVTCPSCYRVWPGSPHRCEACHTLLDYA